MLSRHRRGYNFQGDVSKDDVFRVAESLRDSEFVSSNLLSVNHYCCPTKDSLIENGHTPYSKSNFLQDIAMNWNVIPIVAGLLIVSNIFMTFAWYGHLKDLASKPWYIAVLVSG